LKGGWTVICVCLLNLLWSKEVSVVEQGLGHAATCLVFTEDQPPEPHAPLVEVMLLSWSSPGPTLPSSRSALTSGRVIFFLLQPFSSLPGSLWEV
jgi:hypothetical protein